MLVATGNVGHRGQARWQRRFYAGRPNSYRTSPTPGIYNVAGIMAALDCSMYTKRVVEEAQWPRPFLPVDIAGIVDIVITFCKKNQFDWSFGRAKKQIPDGLAARGEGPLPV